ncbi:MAG: GGDEF domain-containing protein [Candidatus Eremiobacteraeota bacterium]|nr:GGDEF domain-containing protein [Candidatus Eremiobacteraeota bacterium]MBC5827018.1 GGDEF domain-containing protein [Candidatus Eremiobacteraeota bacterium]
MQPAIGAISFLYRRATLPLAIAAVRALAIAQTLVAPMGSAPPSWLAPALLAYIVLTFGLSFPSRRTGTAVEDRDRLNPLKLAAIVLLDVAAASLVAWCSGISALPIVVALDVAALPVLTALAVVAGSTICVALTLSRSHAGGTAAALLEAASLTLVPYLVMTFTLMERRRAEQQIRAINRVLDAGSDLGTKLSLPEVLSQLLNMLTHFRDSVPWQTVVVYITHFDESQKEEILCAEALAGAHADFYRGSKLRFGQGVAGYAAAEQRPFIVADLQKDHREANQPKPKSMRGCLIVPIVSEGSTIGCVALMAALPNSYAFEQQRLVDRLIRLASVGIQNARLHSKTLELADTDSMTGLLTHRAYQERLEAEFHKAQGQRQSLSLLILDVDFFKRVNDSYGHPQGDELLRQLAEVIRLHARKGDVCCRYGGDEFTVVMPETIKAEAVMVANRIRQAVEEKAFQLEEAVARITISIGVSGYPQDVSAKQPLVKAADVALYAAKQSGRNNVKLAGRQQTLQPR